MVVVCWQLDSSNWFSSWGLQSLMTVTSLFPDRAGGIPFLNQLPAHAEAGGPWDAERPRFPTLCHMTDAWRNELLHGDQRVIFCFPVFICPSLSQSATKAAALGHVLCTELTHSHRLCYLSLNQRLDSSLTPQKHLRALLHNPGFTLEYVMKTSLFSFSINYDPHRK